QQLGAAYAAAHGYDVSAMDLKESSSEKRKARRDYTLEWEARPGDPRNVEEARFRVRVSVSGDRVTGLRSFWQIPESYSRSRSRENAFSIAVRVVRLALIVGVIVCGIFMLVRNIRGGLLRWKLALKIAVPAALLMAV